jgi:D-sedoheptulose 7-phosphate isomerase
VLPGASTTTSFEAHLEALREPLERLATDGPTIQRWSRQLATILTGGGRLLVCGNGGSAAHAQHLTAELVGRYQRDRSPFSAIALHAETSAVTAIANDYDWVQLFARQVQAHGRKGDVLLAISTSGRSPNVLAAVTAAREAGILAWALTGPSPNPLAAAAEDSVSVDSPSTATVQEVHQVVVHLLCEAFDEVVLG